MPSTPSAKPKWKKKRKINVEDAKHVNAIRKKLGTLGSDDELDEEGLNTKKGYDVIICGTNLIKSILACALSQTGKKSVLHCDGSFYYGDYDVNITSLNDLFKWCMDRLGNQEKDVVKDELNVMTMDEYITLNRDGGLADLCIHSFSSNGFLNEDDKNKKDYFYSIEIKVGMEVHITSFDMIGTVSSIQINDAITTLGIELSSWSLANNKHPIIYIPSTSTNPPTMKQYNTKL